MQNCTNSGQKSKDVSGVAALPTGLRDKSFGDICTDDVFSMKLQIFVTRIGDLLRSWLAIFLLPIANKCFSRFRACLELSIAIKILLSIEIRDKSQ